MSTFVRLRLLPAPACLLLLLWSAFMAGGCSSGPAPAAEFVAQADALHTNALRSTVAADSQVNAYIAEIGKRIIQGAAAADPKWTRDPVFANMQFHLVGSPIPNAFSTGGQHVYIYNGLLRLCQTEEELAAVMAHEFAHAVSLDMQHTGMKPGPKATPERIAYLFVTFPLYDEMERNADDLGFQFYTRGGWDPAHFADIYQRLIQAALTGPGAGPNRTPLAQRAEHARGLVSSLPASARKWRQPEVADTETFNQLKTAAGSGGEAASLQNPAWLYLRAFPNCILPYDLPAQQTAQQQLRTIVIPPISPTRVEPS